MEHLKEIPFLDKYPVFRKLAAIGDLRKLTPEERKYYDEDIKIIRDLYATDKWEKEQRRMEREAMQKELEAARREKDAISKEKDAISKELDTVRREKENAVIEAKSKSLAIAQRLLSMNIPFIQIMQATGLTEEQIDGLKN